MLIFWEHRLVFFATPKTGTTALEGALSPYADLIFRNPPELKHAPIYRFENKIQPLLDAVEGPISFETVGVIRHPIAWLSSWFRYRCRDGLIGHQNSTRGISFDDFVVEYCKDKPAAFANVGTQSSFITSPQDGSIGLDHLFSYEHFDSLTGFFEERLDISLELKQLNVSPDFAVQLSPDVADLYRKTHKKEFELWEKARL